MAVHFRDLSRIRNLNLLFSRTDQLAALGTFTMGLSHELRNPLAAIKGSAQLLQEKAQGDPAYAPFTQNITREVDRLDKLVRELYDFSRSPGGPRSVTDLSELAREALSQVLRGTPEDKKNSRKIAEFHAPGLPHAMIQKDRMLQAVCNVIQNALEHMPEGADLTVRTFLRQEPPQHMVLEIANTGSSIASADMERIFEPFFSTKSAGMGLGLAIAYQIAAQNRCHLKALSDSDSVRFQFLFRPSAPQIPAAQPEGSSISG